MNTDDWLVTLDQARFIRTLAWSSSISSAVALMRGYYFPSLLQFGVCITSFLYWSKPTYSWRRWVDIAYVHTVITYQLYLALSASNRAPYYVFTLCAWACYPVGWYFHSIGETWLGCIWHGYIHILANIGSTVLYLGEL